MDVPKYWIKSNLNSYKTNASVSSAHGRNFSGNLATLVCGLGQPICNLYKPGTANTSTNTITIPYNRGYGIKALYLRLKLYSTTGHFNYCTVNAGSSWLGSSGGLDGSTNLNAQYNQRSLTAYSATIDASAFTVGTIGTITITKTAVSSANTGIAYVSINEVPRGILDPVNTATDPGLLPDWSLPPSKLQEKTSSDPYGFARMWAELDNARYKSRRHIVQAVDQETPWTVTSTSLRDVFSDSTTVAQFTMRARRLYSTATTNPYKLFVRYASDGTADLKVTHDGGSSASTTVTLASSGGASTWANDSSNTINIPTDGTNQEVTLKFEAKRVTATSLKFATIALIENET